MPALWITNARVIDPASRRDAVGDLFVRDGKIVAALSAGGRKRARKIDARGLVACAGPGRHPRAFPRAGPDPQGDDRDRLAGPPPPAGFTTVVCMPNTAPAADNAGTIQFITGRRAAATRLSRCCRPGASRSG